MVTAHRAVRLGLSSSTNTVEASRACCPSLLTSLLGCVHMRTVTVVVTLLLLPRLTCQLLVQMSLSFLSIWWWKVPSFLPLVLPALCCLSPVLPLDISLVWCWTSARAEGSCGMGQDAVKLKGFPMGACLLTWHFFGMSWAAMPPREQFE